MYGVEQVIAVRDGVAPDLSDGTSPGPSPAVWLSGQEAAEHVGVSWPTLRRAIVDHAIPHVRLGRRWKIEASVLDDYLRQLAKDSGGRA